MDNNTIILVLILSNILMFFIFLNEYLKVKALRRTVKICTEDYKFSEKKTNELNRKLFVANNTIDTLKKAQDVFSEQYSKLEIKYNLLLDAAKKTTKSIKLPKQQPKKSVTKKKPTKKTVSK